MFEEKRATDRLPSFSNSHSLTMFEENRGEVPTFQQFMEKKEGQLEQISKVKSLERQNRFMKKKKTEMVKVIVVSK